MLELYHYAFSTCSQKVRLVLAEKRLDFVSHEIDLIGGRAARPGVREAQPEPRRPHPGARRRRADRVHADQRVPRRGLPGRRRCGRRTRAGGTPSALWTKYLDEKVHPATAVLTFALGPRTLLLQQPAEVREANIASIPDPKDRAARRSVIEHGVKAPEFAGRLRADGRLPRSGRGVAARRGGWLSGGSFGLADAAVLPYVLRLDHLAMTPLLSPDGAAVAGGLVPARASAAELRVGRGRTGYRSSRSSSCGPADEPSGRRSNPLRERMSPCEDERRPA